jgi:hypothetical protein
MVTITPVGSKILTLCLHGDVGRGGPDGAGDLDIAYRTPMGRIYTDAGTMYLNNLPAGEAVAETWAPLRTHGIFAGIRYLFR